MENCGSAVISVIRFLRGHLINHDTPSDTSHYPIETRSPPLGTWNRPGHYTPGRPAATRDAASQTPGGGQRFALLQGGPPSYLLDASRPRRIQDRKSVV